MKIRLLCLLIICFVSCEDHNLVSSDYRCLLDPDPGLCFAAIPKYYYDRIEGKCKEFTWGGCGGVVPFNSLEECHACE